MSGTAAVRHLPRAVLPMRPVTLITSLLLVLTTAAQPAAPSAGARVEILNADVWEFDDHLAAGAQRLKGHVRFKHADAIMNCDSAHLFKDQRVEAFGHVTIDQGDSLHADADRLHYDSKERLARLEGNVRLRDRDMELTTSALDYDLRNRRAFYSTGGTIVSQREGNTLTSGAGTYHAAQRRFIFSRNVHLQHPERTIDSDTMHYVTSTGMTEFFGSTIITQGDNAIRTLRGTYDTRADRARLTRRSSVLSNGRLLEGDSLHYDRGTGIGLAWGHVAVTDSSGDMRALGDLGRYNELEDRSMITGHAELVMRMGSDTLFLHGDTLFTSPDGPGRRIIARRHVRFYKSDMQGACDTLTYSDVDSLIHMHHLPVLWSGTDQITGDVIRIALRDGKAHRLFVEGNAFLVSEADSVHFDQVTGTSMTGYFHDNELSRLDTEGNARTVYFAREKKDEVEEIVGVNRADCSRIRVTMAEGRVSKVTFLDRPDAVLYPLEKAPVDELLMEGLVFRGDERPMDRAAIFLP